MGDETKDDMRVLSPCSSSFCHSSWDPSLISHAESGAEITAKPPRSAKFAKKDFVDSV